MSIIVQNLTKIYGAQRALDEVTFSADKGKITGFLGPNGAGKSTTMKVATGYLKPTSGTVFLDGIDVSIEPLKVKKLTGYLPEHNPLYLEMYVKEYLRFIGAAYKLKSINRKVDEVVELVGLTQEQSKKIQSLSKGYRQRVGLAQALLHDPEVLILDEPTSGLDPNQLVEVRKVIKQASQDKTVIFSTHIMQEVEALCDNVVIINKGKIVANDEVANLKSMQSAAISYRVAFEKEVDTNLFEKEGIEARHEHDFTYVFASKSNDPRKSIMKIVGSHELPLVTILKVEQSLESVFQDLTKEA